MSDDRPDGGKVRHGGPGQRGKAQVVALAESGTAANQTLSFHFKKKKKSKI
jgi:hypothetical protein